MQEKMIGRSRIRLLRGDITNIQVDAIVNAANASLAGGGGVDGAIHRAGGPSIMKECRSIGGCATGSAVMTGAGRLPARNVIHAVAPRYTGKPKDAGLLRSAYVTSLQLANDAGHRSIAFPSLGTGAYRYPIQEAATVALVAVVEHLRAGSSLENVTFVLFSEEDLKVYEAALNALESNESGL